MPEPQRAVSKSDSVDLARDPSPLDELAGTSLIALYVYVRLQQYSRENCGGAPEFQVTRAQIAKISIIQRLPTISAALGLLAEHSWISKTTYNEYAKSEGGKASHIKNRWLKIRLRKDLSK